MTAMTTVEQKKNSCQMLVRFKIEIFENDFRKIEC